MESDHEQEQSQSLSDYIAIAKRRKKPMLMTAGIVMFICLLITVLWPPTYRSTAVILIEEQDVPQDLVRTTITSYAVQRIEEIKQRIMTISNIMSIAERFDLYSEREMKRLTRSEISQDFRRSVSILPISAEVIDPRSGRPTEAVIAFSLSFDGKKINTVHKVTNELVTLYLNENLRERTEQSNSTSEFLSAEAGALNAELKQLEQQISEFKEQNKGSLPELSSFNMSIVDRSQRELLDVSTRHQELKRRKIELEAELAQLNPTSPQVLASGEMVLSDSDRLKALRSEYRKKAALYRDSHPDLQRLRREIASLEHSQGEVNGQRELAKQLQTARDRLATLRDKYTDSHPEIIQLQTLITQLENDLSNPSQIPDNVTPDNPAYVLLNTQLQSINSEVIALQDKQKTLREKIAEHDNLLSRTPAVEKDYHALLRDYENTRLKYREIKAKQMSAELAKNLEQERKGERFTLIQPPEIPENPVSPNRILLLLISIILAAGLGAGTGALLELLDSAVYGERAIVAATGIAPMVIIPFMEDDLEKSNNRHTYIVAALAAVVCVVLAITLFHFFVKPIDVAWYMLLRKFGLN